MKRARTLIIFTLITIMLGFACIAWKCDSKEDIDDTPNCNTTIVNNQGHIFIGDIDSSEVADAFAYFASIEKFSKTVIIELHSPGGAYFDAVRIVGIMRTYESKGWIVQTEVHGLAASAAFLIFEAGSPDHRLANSTAEFMWHEISIAMCNIYTSATSKDLTTVLKHLQDEANQFIADHCDLTKKEIDNRIYKQEFWFNGETGLKNGTVDHLLD